MIYCINYKAGIGRVDDITMCYLFKIRNFKYNDINRLQIKDGNIYKANINQNKTQMAISLLDKVDFRAKKTTRNEKDITE